MLTAPTLPTSLNASPFPRSPLPKVRRDSGSGTQGGKGETAEPPEEGLQQPYQAKTNHGVPSRQNLLFHQNSIHVKASCRAHTERPLSQVAAVETSTLRREKNNNDERQSTLSAKFYMVQHNVASNNALERHPRHTKTTRCTTVLYSDRTWVRSNSCCPTKKKNTERRVSAEECSK